EKEQGVRPVAVVYYLIRLIRRQHTGTLRRSERPGEVAVEEGVPSHVSSQSPSRRATRFAHAFDLLSLDDGGVRFGGCLRFVVVGERARPVTGGPEKGASSCVAFLHKRLHCNVAGVGLGQALDDRQRSLVALQRGRKVALSIKHFADLGTRI